MIVHKIMKVSNIVLAIILTIITILISYKTSEEIKNIVNQTYSENKTISEKNYTESIENESIEINKVNIEKESLNASNFTIPFPSSQTSEISKSETTKFYNYSILEEAYIFDFCIIKENEQFFEGGASKCLNKREPYKFIIKDFGSFISISFDKNVSFNYTKKDEILIGIGYAKNFKGIEEVIKSVFSNSSEIKIGNFYFGERYVENYLVETYLIFPVYIINLRNSTNFIFVGTDLKNYLIGKIDIEYY